MSHGVEGRNSAAAVDRETARQVLRHLDLVVGERSGRRTIYALHDSHGGVLLEEAVDHVEQHIRLGFPEPASAKRARSR